MFSLTMIHSTQFCERALTTDPHYEKIRSLFASHPSLFSAEDISAQEAAWKAAIDEAGGYTQSLKRSIYSSAVI